MFKYKKREILECVCVCAQASVENPKWECECSSQQETDIHNFVLYDSSMNIIYSLPWNEWMNGYLFSYVTYLGKPLIEKP